MNRDGVRCACCGRTSDWSALDVVQRLETDTLAALVTRWPDELSVEVRRCECGRSIARTAKRRPLSPDLG